jgi:hypothetical protein
MRGPPDEPTRRDKAVIFLWTMAWSFGVLIAGLLSGYDRLSYPGLAAWFLLLASTACWFYFTRDR